MYLIWKPPPWRLAPMVQEVIIQPSKRGKQPTVIATCGACDPEQQPAWQQWHAVSCGRKQIGLIGFSTWGKLPAVGNRQLPRAREVMGFGEKNHKWDFTNTGTVIINVLNTLMPQMSVVLTLPLIFKRMDFFHFFLKPFDSFLTIPCRVRKNNQLLSCSACYLSSSANSTPCLKLYDIGPLHRKAWGLHDLWQDEYHSCFLLLSPSPFSECRCPSKVTWEGC